MLGSVFVCFVCFVVCFLACKSGLLEPLREQVMNDGVGGPGLRSCRFARKERCGFPEVIFCEGKTKEWVEAWSEACSGGQHLATRLSEEQATHLARAFHKPKSIASRPNLLAAITAPRPDSGQGRHHRRAPVIAVAGSL